MSPKAVDLSPTCKGGVIRKVKSCWWRGKEESQHDTVGRAAVTMGKWGKGVTRKRGKIKDIENQKGKLGEMWEREKWQN